MATPLATAAANDDDGGSCRRGAKRTRVLLSATMTTASAVTRVVLKDISRTGALIDSPVAPPLGSYVLFTRGAISVRAMVVRREGRQVALHFQEEVDEASLLISLGTSPLISKH